MDAFEEILVILKENNSLLKEIKELLLLQMGDNEYTQNQDFRAFCINVTADLFVEMMNDDKEFREKMMSRFKQNKIIIK